MTPRIPRQQVRTAPTDDLDAAIARRLDLAQQERARLPGVDAPPVDPDSFSGKVLAAQERRAAERRAIDESYRRHCTNLWAMHEAERVRQAQAHAEETAVALDAVAALDKEIGELSTLLYEKKVKRAQQFARATRYEPETWGDPDLPPRPETGSPSAGHGMYMGHRDPRPRGMNW